MLHDTFAESRKLAAQVYEYYEAFLEAGFTKVQAWELVTIQFEAAVTSPPQG